MSDENSTEDLDVIRKKKGVRLNSQLLDRQKAWDNIEGLKILHRMRLLIEEVMENSDKPSTLKACDVFYDLVETQLQDQWKFDRNPNFFKFWNRPKCGCPSMDNDDGYPYGRYVISGDCKVHGK